MKMRVRALAAVVVLVLQGALGAHDIPDEIVLQSYVSPEQNRLQVLLRIPLLAVADANLPKDGPGYLAMQYLDPALGEAANDILNGIVFLEEDERLTGYALMHARISLPSDRSFDTYERALAHVRGPKLPARRRCFTTRGSSISSSAFRFNRRLRRLRCACCSGAAWPTGRQRSSTSFGRTGPFGRSESTTIRLSCGSIPKRIRPRGSF